MADNLEVERDEIIQYEHDVVEQDPNDPIVEQDLNDTVVAHDPGQQIGDNPVQDDPAIKDEIPFSMYIIVAVLIIDLLGFTVILPLMPTIFEYYSANKEDNLYHQMETYVRNFQNSFGFPDRFNKVLFAGFIGSVFSALQFLVAPIFGCLSDVYGRKPVLIASMCGIIISNAVWCVSDFFYLFFIARVIGGLSRANISLSTAVVTDLCSEKKRGSGMAMMGIAFGIGFICGPMIGAYFASHSTKDTPNFYVYPAVFALVMTVVAVMVLLLWFKESLPEEKRLNSIFDPPIIYHGTSGIAQAKSIGQGLIQAYRFISPYSLFSFSPVKDMRHEEKDALQQVGLIYFLFLFIYSGLEYSLSFLTHMRFNFTSMQQGQMYLFSGVVMILIQGGVVRRIPPGNELKYASSGAMVIILAFMLIGCSSNVYVLYAGLLLYAFASATVVPCLTTVASKFGSASQKGTVLGIFRSLGSLARAFGPIVFAIAYSILTPTYSYIIGGLLLAVPCGLILKLNTLLVQLVEKQD